MPRSGSGFPVDRFGFPRADPRYFKLETTDALPEEPYVELTRQGADLHVVLARVSGPVTAWEVRRWTNRLDTGWVRFDDLDAHGGEFRGAFGRLNRTGNTNGLIRAVNRGGEGPAASFTLSPPRSS